MEETFVIATKSGMISVIETVVACGVVCHEEVVPALPKVCVEECTPTVEDEVDLIRMIGGVVVIGLATTNVTDTTITTDTRSPTTTEIIGIEVTDPTRTNEGTRHPREDIPTTTMACLRAGIIHPAITRIDTRPATIAVEVRQDLLVGPAVTSWTTGEAVAVEDGANTTEGHRLRRTHKPLPPSFVRTKQMLEKLCV